jgi:hypothetical protein
MSNISPEVAKLIESDNQAGISYDPKDILRHNIKLVQQNDNDRFRPPGAQDGDLYLAGTAKPIVAGDIGVRMLPLKFRHGWVERRSGEKRDYVETWQGRPKDAEWNDRAKGYKRANGNVVYEQIEIIVLVEGDPRPWRLFCTGKEGLARAAALNDTAAFLHVEINGERHPLPFWGAFWRVTTELEGGSSWYVLKFELEGVLGEPRGPASSDYLRARDVYQTIAKTPDHPEPPAAALSPTKGNGSRQPAPIDDDIPF